MAGSLLSWGTLAPRALVRILPSLKRSLDTVGLRWGLGQQRAAGGFHPTSACLLPKRLGLALLQ